MKSHREKSIKDIKINDPGVGNMHTADEEINIDKEFGDLKKMLIDRHKPGSNAFEIKQLDKNIVNLSQKIATAKKKIYDNRKESIEFF